MQDKLLNIEQALKAGDLVRAQLLYEQIKEKRSPNRIRGILKGATDRITGIFNPSKPSLRG